MIRFAQSPEPILFDKIVRQRGNNWITNHPTSSEFPGYWRDCIDDLEDAFDNLCAYTAMYLPEGTGSVDHYLCKSRRKYHHLVYEWSNYRLTSSTLNSSKGTHDRKILDPFQVGNGWFRVILPSCQLVMTDMVPVRSRRRAEFTMERFGLVDSRSIVRRRKKLLRGYESGKMDLDMLKELAPLVAEAVARQKSLLAYVWISRSPYSPLTPVLLREVENLKHYIY